MTNLNLNTLISNFTQATLADFLGAHRDELNVNVNVTGLWRGSRSEIASARLAVWYTAELLADHGNVVGHSDIEQTDGSGDVSFTVNLDRPAELAARLLGIAPAFDPDEDEAWWDFEGEIYEWLENGGPADCRFAQLKENFELDREAFREWEEDQDELDDDDDR